MQDEMDEKQVDALLEQDRKADAIELLFGWIVKCSRERDFAKAEALRERILEVDDTALSEIIKSAEIIEAEKSKAVDHDHMDLWSELYSILSTEESNALYFALKQIEVGPDEIVFKQGQKNDRLYFVDKGELKLFYVHQDVESLIYTIASGSIAGEDTFFAITACTTSLAAVSSSKIRYLTQKDYQNFEQKMPTLASRLQTYCSKLIKSDEILKEKGISRRDHERHRLVTPIVFQLLDASGRPLGKPLKGDLEDVSCGGLSFSIKVGNRQKISMLLGRRLRAKFNLPLAAPPTETMQDGLITGVISHHFGDYSVHMRFDSPLEPTYMDALGKIPEHKRTSSMG